MTLLPYFDGPSHLAHGPLFGDDEGLYWNILRVETVGVGEAWVQSCLLYTSDAADE